MVEIIVASVIIIGSGCAGLTAAIYSARADLNPIVIEGIQPGGQLTTTTEIENFPGFPEGVGGFELVMNMKQQAENFGTTFINDNVISVDFSGDVKKIKCKDKEYHTKAVIIATGATPRMLKIPGESKFYGGKGVSVCATCDGAFYKNKVAVVIGGGDTACEDALFLSRFCSKVYIVHRRDTLRASKVMAERVLSCKNIEMVWNSAAKEILGTEKVSGIIVQNIETGKSSNIDCSAVFLAIGHIPNTEVFSSALKVDDQGYFVANNNSLVETEIRGVFVAGDCADKHFRQAITAAGMGCMAAISAERFLSLE